MNSYTLEIESNSWRIVHLEGAWYLKRRVDTNEPIGTHVIVPVGVFATAAEAAEAVADGTTGEADWDMHERTMPRVAYLLPAWKVGLPFESRAPFGNQRG